MRPRVILLSGAPGTGKSTLGRLLAATIRVPFIARDDIRGGLLFSAGAWGEALERVPSGDEAVEVFLQTVESLTAQGVSCVVEYVVRSHRPQDLERIRSAADCVVIVTSCPEPTERLVERNRTDALIASPAVLRAAGVASVEEHTATMLERMREVERAMARDFPGPALHVDTTDGYDPSMWAIVDFATRRHTPPEVGGATLA